MKKISILYILLTSTASFGQSIERYDYDSLGRIKAREKKGPTGNGSLNNYLYDKAGNRVAARSSGPFRSVTLLSGTGLSPGQTVLSSDNRFRLVFQFDGNLVLYDSVNQAIWYTGTQDRDAVRVQMQSDGNLVIYTSRQEALWVSGTQNHPDAYLQVQNDGNVAIVSGGVGIWTTNTCCR